jgi:predicted negative regulator of RcsB-dependent stress response
MREGHVPETAEIWRLLADAWVAARNRDKAERPLERAAAHASDGQLYLRLAHVQIEREEWTAARKSLTHALEKGGLSDPGNAQLLLGIASASDSDWKGARKAFEAAAGYEGTASAAKQWLLEVEAETREEEVPPDPAPAPAPAGTDVLENAP